MRPWAMGEKPAGTEIRQRPLRAVPGAAEASAEPSCPSLKDHLSATTWVPRDPRRKDRPPIRQGQWHWETPSFSNPRPVP